MQQSSWKESLTPWPSLQTWEGSRWVTTHVRKSQNISIVTAVFEHQCDLFRKRWSLIWSRIQDITSSFIYSRVWHYTTAISLYSAKNLTYSRQWRRNARSVTSTHENTFLCFQLWWQREVQGKHWQQYDQRSHQDLHPFLNKLALWDNLHCPELSSTNREQYISQVNLGIISHIGQDPRLITLNNQVSVLPID